METFSALLAICAGNSPVPGEFHAQRPMTRSFDVFFDLRLNKRLSDQSWGWWFETLSRPLWRHRNENGRRNLADEYLNLWGRFYWHGLTLIPAWISSYIHYEVWDEITYSFPNFNGEAAEDWEWISNIIPHIFGHGITYQCCGKKNNPCK